MNRQLIKIKSITLLALYCFHMSGTSDPKIEPYGAP